MRLRLHRLEVGSRSADEGASADTARNDASLLQLGISAEIVVRLIPSA